MERLFSSTGFQTTVTSIEGRYPRLGLEEREHIERYIFLGQEMVANLKRKLNADIWINCLPDELLLEVFQYYIALQNRELGSAGRYNFFSRRGNKHISWIRLTHVCHHWRRLSLSYAAFWAKIRLMRYSSAHAFLERSQQAPLSIHCRILYSDAVERTKKYVLFQKILAESRRIRALTLQYNNTERTGARDRVPAEPDMGRCEFPVLEKLEVVRETGDEDTLPSFVARCASFPHLQDLCLKNYNLPLVQSLVQRAPKLSKLRLGGYSSDLMIDCRAFLSFLGSLPQLEELILGGEIRHSEVQAGHMHIAQNQSSVASNFVTITLPNLKFLRLVSPVKSAPILLRHISHPAHTTLSIDVDPPTPGMMIEYGLAALAEAIGSHTSGKQIIGAKIDPILSLSVGSFTERDVHVYMWRDALSITSDAGDANHSHISSVHRDACIQIHFIHYSIVNVFRHFFPTLPMQTVQRLFVGGRHADDYSHVPCQRTWREAFAGAVEIRELTVYANASRNLPGALRPTLRPPVGNGTWGSLFPRIDTLCLQYIELTQDDAVRWKTDMPPDGWAATHLRAEEGMRQGAQRMRLAKLVIRKARQIDLLGVSLLEQCLGASAVEWDGIEKWGTRTVTMVEYLAMNRDHGWVDDDV